MPGKKIDCLLIHVPKETTDHGIQMTFMAMGVFAMADVLQKNGYSSRIIHLGVEKIADSEFSIEKYLMNNDVRSVGISLHWHYQSGNCMSLVDKIKSIQPKIKVILGGFTASFFADEIMRDFRNVDFVIRGDAEIPLLRLIKAITGNRSDLSQIPNLSWRRKDLVIHNNQTYVATEADINRLIFSNFELMEHFDIYSRVPLILRRYSKELLLKHSTFFLCVGRGCPVVCSFCGGSCLSQRIINGRDGVIYRSYESVLKTIEDSVRAGIDRLYVSFDPDPNREYYLGLFRLIREREIKISMVFECWSLPTLVFIDEFKTTFGSGKYSGIVLSPDTASERLRQLNKGFFYTNDDLIKVVQYLKSNCIQTAVYFSYPLPFESTDDRDRTDSLMKSIKRELQNYGMVSIQDFDLDPASSMYLFPAKYGIVKKVTSFSDYCNTQRKRKFLPQDLNDTGFKNTYQKWLNLAAAEEKVSQGQVCFTLNSYEDASQKALQAVKLAPQETGAYLLLGSCYERTNSYDDAMNVYREALDIAPDEGIFYLRLASIYSALGEYGTALVEANRAIELGYDDSGVRLLVGYCYEKTGDFAKAIENFTKAEEMNSDAYYANFSLSNCYREIGQIERANKEMDKGYLKFKKQRKARIPESIG